MQVLTIASVGLNISLPLSNYLEIHQLGKATLVNHASHISRMQDIFRLDGSVLGSVFGSVFSSVRSGSLKKLPGAIGEKLLQLCSEHNRRKCRETRERWLYPNVRSSYHRLSPP